MKRSILALSLLLPLVVLTACSNDGGSGRLSSANFVPPPSLPSPPSPLPPSPLPLYLAPTFCGDSNATPPPVQNAPDPLLKYQWYLDRLSVKDVWNTGINGTGAQVVVMDIGVEIDHEDLKDKIPINGSLNVNPFPGSHPSNQYNPTNCGDAHGTAAAGIIAATGDNGLGIKGIAYGAKLLGVNYLNNPTDLNLQRGLTHAITQTAVSSNSWTSGSPTRLRRRLSSGTESALQLGLERGFNGKGVSYVFAAGNYRNAYYEIPPNPTFLLSEDLTTYEGLRNHHGIIVVCAVDYYNLSASYSTPGANLWICGLSHHLGRPFFAPEQWGLPTTDLSGDAGYNGPLNAFFTQFCSDGKIAWNREYPNGANLTQVRRKGLGLQCLDFGRPFTYTDLSVPVSRGDANYHRFFTGTSAAAPTVSGVIALLRSANKDLTWRDIKLVLAESAEQVDNRSAVNSVAFGWQTAGQTYHNGSANYTHHHNYGFGLVNAPAALALAQNWTLAPPLKQTLPIQWTTKNRTHANQTYRFLVNDRNRMNITFVEYARVDVQSNYSNFGALNVTLVSPRGSQSMLAKQHPCLTLNRTLSGILTRNVLTALEHCPDLMQAFTFGTAVHLGEDPSGVWQLQIVGPNQEGTDYTASMTLHGHRRR